MRPKEVYELLNIAFALEREAIGVKFLKTKEEFDEEEAKEIINPMIYCVCIKSSMEGHPLKVGGDNFKCGGSGSSFGFMERGEPYHSGQVAFSLGLHKDVETSKEVTSQMYVLEEGEFYGVLAKPLNMFTDSEPDVVLVTTNPYNAMRFSQAYAYEFGLKKNFDIAGNQAVCVESTLIPMIDKDMNISMFCAGTRHSAQWNDDELMVGISWEIIDEIVNGIISTINRIEPDEKKEEIIARNGSNEINGEKITMGTGYFYES